MKRSKFVALVLVFVMSIGGLHPVFAQNAEQPNNEVSGSNGDSNASTIDKVTASVAVAAGIAFFIKALSEPEKPKVEEKKSSSSWWSFGSEEEKKPEPEPEKSWWPF